MTEIIAYAALAYLAVQLLVAAFNLLTRQSLRPSRYDGQSTVSVLIPARNEEENIGHLLDDLAALQHRPLETIVYDDDSTDGTAEVVRKHMARLPGLAYLSGGQLPGGWLGKNHACHQLAHASKGDFLLFLDADVRVRPELVNDALAYINRHNLALLSLFPVQRMKTLGEWLTVPLMNRILVGNLPLLLVRKTKMPDFAAANGQFMLFDAAVYKRHWFHRQVSNEKVEDIRIMRLIKKLGYRGQVLLSGGQASCRMYRGFGGAVNGFARNIHAFFGRNWLVLSLYLALTTLGPMAAWLALPFPLFFAYMGGIILFRTAVSVQSRQSWWRNILLIPLQQMALLTISFLAAYRQAKGGLLWKGRPV